MHFPTLRNLIPLAGLGLLASTASAQATLDTHSPSGAARMTPDGQTIVGSGSQGAWLYTTAGGYVQLGGGGGVDLSDDAAVVAGNRVGASTYDGPALWDAVNGWVDLGGIPGQTPPGDSHGTAYQVSGDGAVVVGLGWHSNWKARGFRWDATTGVVELPQMGPNSSRASAISGDGLWIGGFDEAANGTRRAALWDAGLNETLFLVRPENPNGYGEINDMNHDGTVIVGIDTLDTEPGSGYRWTPTEGVVRFGPVPGVDPWMNYNWASACSEDGEVVVGGNWDLFMNTTYATIWTEATGVMFLHDYLTALGVPGLDMIQLASATDVSADGTKILGWGVTPPFNFIWWEARIPSCNGGTASFCITSPNSVGSGALIGSNGHVSVASNSLELTAGPVPDEFGLFFLGDSTTQVPLGDGFLCLSGKLYRFPAELASGNVLRHEVDFGAWPAAGLLDPGSTWHFQAWYRDPAAGGTGSNFSDGLTVTFCD